LKKYINNFAILIYGSPKITLLTVDLDENLINEKYVSLTLVLSAQPGSIFRAEFVTPQSD